MIPIASSVRICLTTGHTDMRPGMPGLALFARPILTRHTVGNQVVRDPNDDAPGCGLVSEAATHLVTHSPLSALNSVTIRRAPRCRLQPFGEELRRPDEPERRRFWPSSRAVDHQGAWLDGRVSLGGRQRAPERQSAIRPAKAISGISMIESQRRPLALAKWPCEDRVGSR